MNVHLDLQAILSLMGGAAASFLGTVILLWMKENREGRKATLENTLAVKELTKSIGTGQVPESILGRLYRLEKDYASLRDTMLNEGWDRRQIERRTEARD